MQSTDKTKEHLCKVTARTAAGAGAHGEFVQERVPAPCWFLAGVLKRYCLRFACLGFFLIFKDATFLLHPLVVLGIQQPFPRTPPIPRRGAQAPGAEEPRGGD